MNNDVFAASDTKIEQGDQAGEPTTSSRNTGAFEIKFLVDQNVGNSVLEIARSVMQPDPHSQADRIDGYEVNSLYFDTPDWDVYRRNAIHGQQKLRLRRYGNMYSVFAECKKKKKGIVHKQRSIIPASDLDRFVKPVADPVWAGSWFQERLTRYQLEPKVQISYERSARVLHTDHGLIRLTLDQTLRYRVQESIAFPDAFMGHDLLAQQCILELKFQAAMPDLFKDLMYRFQLVPQPFSKYRLAIKQLQMITPELQSGFPNSTQASQHA